uniref:AB hydrolase-1 domain-containing protein n=1 Tax=Angiostrongylus cantonensis TaxID=6313 RepID=A0A0K0CU59_ANGCA
MISKEPSAFIRCEKLQFDTSDGQSIVVEDTMPSGSHIGAVLAIHGSPGSHKDFKYVMPLLQAKGIRFVGVNMPGYGLTPGDPALRYDNTERNNFVHELIARIGNLKRLVVLSHSRGSENAIGVAVRNMVRER